MRKKPGVALLISLIILLAMILSFALLGAFILSESVQNDTSREQKAIASASAQACMDLALQRLVLNNGYSGNQVNNMDGITCAIRPIIQTSGQWIIETSATYGQQTTKLRTVLTSLGPLAVASWLELCSF